MASLAFRRRIRAIQDGEPVDAAVAGRPDADLQGNLSYVLDLLDMTQAGQGAVRRAVSLDPALVVGMAVYWDPVQSRFAPALAATIEDPTTGSVGPAPSAECVGIVLEKLGATLGDILVAGYGRVDLAAALQDGGTVQPGRYYLSTRTPGMLAQPRPAIATAVLVADGIGGVYVQPTPRDFLEGHIHYAFTLAARPAGTGVTAADGRETIAGANAALPGWLPAGDASFAGHAPPGAAFGYNLAAHPALNRVWPPVPLDAVTAWVDRGSGHVGATAAPMGRAGLVAVDALGIWWMSDCIGDCPWPEGYDPAAPPVADNAPTGPECPRAEEMQITLAFARMTFATAASVVNSIRPSAGSPISFRDCDGNPARTGDLFAGIDLSFIEDPTLIAGGLAFKELNNQVLKRGWVVEGVRAGANCTATGSHSETRGGGAGQYTLYQGEVVVNAVVQPGEIEPEIERLGDAQQRYYEDVPYVGLGTDRAAGIRFSFDVPPGGIPPSPQFQLRAWVLGRATGTLPALAASCRVLPRPAAGVAQALPTRSAEAAMTLPVGGRAVTANQYVEVLSDPVPITAGCKVLVQLSRSPGDGYSDEVGVLRTGVVISGATG